MKKILCIIALVALASPATFAAEKQPRIIYKKKTSIDFNDAIVEGQIDNPEGVYVVTPPEKKFGSLLKLRPNFHRETLRDALLLK
jgi:hypothetical protein